MPRTLPPTPQSSTDITAKSPPTLSGVELAFTLPPPALGSVVASGPCFDPRAPPPPPPPLPSSSSSPSPPSHSYRPLSPTSPSIPATANQSPTDDQAPKRRRRAPSTLENPKSQQAPVPKRKLDEITLPPPPSRARKIIQMRPRHSPSSGSGASSSSTAAGGAQTESSPLESKRSRKTAVPPKLDGKPGDEGKSTTAAGRKTARKTAHSLIERRRRFKMNEEFGVLKGMIPACRGVEMHKLAILQASIEYLKYLEQCVSDLKASNYVSSSHNEGGRDLMLPPPLRPSAEVGFEEEDGEEGEDGEEEEEEEEEEVEEVEERTTEPNTPRIPPPVFASPHLHASQVCPPRSASGSPVMHAQQKPQQQHDCVDTEATHALLLLADGRRNSTDEFSSGSNSNSRGMRVKDLLSA